MSRSTSSSSLMLDTYPFGSWSLTVVQCTGLHYLRHEKSWRPIVKVEVGERDHQHFETVLGSDGQNPNQKECFTFHDVAGSTRIQLSIWQKSQSKKKGKKRNLVSTGSCTLGELMRKQGHARKSEIKMSIAPSSQRKTRGRAQGGAFMIVRVMPPRASASLEHMSRLSTRTSSPEPTEHEIIQVDDDSASSSASEPSESVTPPHSPLSSSTTYLPPYPPPPAGIRKRRPRGFMSDDDVPTDASSCPAPSDDELDRLCAQREIDEEIHQKPEPDPTIEITPTPESISVSYTHSSSTTLIHQPHALTNDGIFLAPSLLPRSATLNSTLSADRVSVASSVSVAEKALDAVSPYRSIRDAQVDSEWEAILERLQKEWYFVGGSLVALAALFSAVFGFGSDTIFPVDGIAQRAVALGAVASGLGISIDAWLIFSYSGADAAKFQRKARDVFDTYFFFALNARLPAFFLLIASLALMVFLLAVSWSTWSTVVIIGCFFLGVIVSLQWLVKGMHSFALGLARMVRAVRRGCVALIGVLRRDAGGGTPEGGGVQIEEVSENAVSAPSALPMPPIPARSTLRAPPLRS